MEYNFPTTYEEYYTKGTFTSVDDNLVYFELPSVFNEDLTVNETLTLQTLNEFIQTYNDKIEALQQLLGND